MSPEAVLTPHSLSRSADSPPRSTGTGAIAGAGSSSGPGFGSGPGPDDDNERGQGPGVRPWADQHSGSRSNSTSEPQRKKRVQVTTACNECRRRKIKCDGQRPACDHCLNRPTTCHYEVDPDVTPSLALRRKLEDLQQRSADSDELLLLLRQLPQREAIVLLSVLRSTCSIEVTLAHHRRHGSRNPSSASSSLEQSRRPSPAAPYSQSAPAASLVIDSHDLSRLNLAYWGVNYLDLHSLVNILRSYITWDHPPWTCFDSDAFLAGLVAGGNDECTRLLLHAVLAVGSKNYKATDPVLGATVEHFALVEAKRLWELDSGNDRLINIPAGLLLHCALCSNGSDKEGHAFLSGAIRIAHNIGLYRPGGAQKPNDMPTTGSPRARSLTAWGAFAYASYVAFTMHDEPLLTMPPVMTAPFPLPHGFQQARQISTGPTAGDTLTMDTSDTSGALMSLWTIGMKVLLFHRRRDESIEDPAVRQAEELHAELVSWYHGLPEHFMSTRDTTAHVLVIQMHFYHIILELFRPFAAHMHKQQQSHPAEQQRQQGPGQGSQRPTQVSISSDPGAFYDKIMRPMIEAQTKLRDLLHLYETNHHSTPVPLGINVCLLDVTFDSLARLSHAPDAEHNVLLCLRIFRRLAELFDIDRYMLEGIRTAANRRQIQLPRAIQEIFTQFRKDRPWMPGVHVVRSAYPVDQLMVHYDFEAAKLENLIDGADGLAIE